MSILPLCRAPLLRCVAQATISVAHGDSNQKHPGRARNQRKLCSAPSRPAGEERGWAAIHAGVGRSEEQSSELQSLMRISYAVFCLNKKHKTTNTYTHNYPYNLETY